MKLHAPHIFRSHKGSARLLTVALLLAGSLKQPTYAQIVFNEIMFHPQSHQPSEEYVELLNASRQPVNLYRWKITGGIEFEFPDITIPPNGLIVVCANVEAFRMLYPTVTNFVGNWQGMLSNSSDHLRLIDAQGNLVDEVRYADEGDWAIRQLGPVDYGHRGLEWASAADGQGASLECLNPHMPRNTGQNWGFSLINGGTPGRPNTLWTNDIAPLILEVRHSPVVPHSNEPIVVQAQVIDEEDEPASVLLHYRKDQEGADFETVTMNDEGKEADLIPKDHIFTGVIPGQSSGTIIEFYITATDRSGHTRTWPAPVWVDNHWEQRANALILVEDLVYTGSLPLYRIVMKRADRAELRQINRNSPPAPYPTTDQTRSHAEFNASFFAFDGTHWDIRYLVSVRNRGNAARARWPQSLRVNFRADQPWKNRVAINLNSWYPHLQLLGSALYRHAGLPCQEAWPVQVRINDAFLAEAGAPSYGFTVCNEVLDSYFAKRQFPLDPSGNLYRCIRLVGNGPDLHYEGPDPEPYRANYFKRTNKAVDDWSDLINLTYVLDRTDDQAYVQEVLRSVDVEEWMLYFALETIVVNKETNLANANGGDGRGDDYLLYFGVEDPRARVLPYDLDTILGEGDTRGSPTEGIYRMIANPVLRRFVTHPQFLPIYLQKLRCLTETTFRPDIFNGITDQFLSELVPPEIISRIKQFNQQRVNYISQLLTKELRTEVALPATDGFYHTTNRTISLSGRADPVVTRLVSVSAEGQSFEAIWDRVQANWSIEGVPLQPGLNRLLISSVGESGQPLQTNALYVILDSPQVTWTEAVVSGQVVWSPDHGEYYIPTTVTVAAGGKLIIQPGTVVKLGPGASLIVEQGASLVAIGTELRPILFTRNPDQSSWGQMLIRGQADIRHAWIQYNGTTAVHVMGGDLTLDHVFFATPTHQYLSLDGASFVVNNCHFPDADGEFELVHGTGGIKPGGIGIFYRCFFGKARGYNDVIDFTGGKRTEGQIVHFVDNVFAGSGDDLLDLDGTDAWVEHNIFLHCHRNGAPDTSSAVSGGSYAGRPSFITIYRNIIIDCDHAATAKEGNFYVMLYNTILHINHQGGQEPTSAVVNLADEGTEPGLGFYLEGNVIQDITNLLRNDTPDSGKTIWNNNIISIPWSGPGTNNQVRPYYFKQLPTVQLLQFTNHESAQILWRWLAPAPGEQLLGASTTRGPISPIILGLPTLWSTKTNIELSIGPVIDSKAPWRAGFSRYKYRFSGQEWSEWIEAEGRIVIDASMPPQQIELILKTDGNLQLDDPRLEHLDLAPIKIELPRIDRPSTLVLSEIFAYNQSLPLDGKPREYIEVFNPTHYPISLEGYGLSSDRAAKAFFFPSDAVLQPGEFLLVLADADIEPGGLYAGFRLQKEGGTVSLIRLRGQDIETVDSITYGPQIPDFSIGRDELGIWRLCAPTPAAPNLPTPVGQPERVKINEWMSKPSYPVPSDFIELYNPQPLPVDIGGLLLTDNVYGWPSRYRLPPLSFIQPFGFLVLRSNSDGPLSLPFKLSSNAGLCALLTQTTNVIDTIVHPPQGLGSSEGRSPDGSPQFALQPAPSPGAPNFGTVQGTAIVTNQTVVLISQDAFWHYSTSGSAPSGWYEPNFDDSTWQTGQPLFYHEEAALPWPKTTPIPLGQIAYYFRSQFEPPASIQPWAYLELWTVIDDGAVFYLNGQEVLRIGMPQGQISSSSLASRTVDNATVEGPFLLPISLLRVGGPNVLAAEVHQSSKNSSDIVFGAVLQLVTPITNVAAQPILLNEVATCPTAGFSSGWIEIYNSGQTHVDLTGMAITDDPQQPRRWVFPEGTVLGPGEYLLITCDPTLPSNLTNTGFGLSRAGGAIYLFDAVERGGRLIDALTYGIQPSSDYAIGRIPDTTGKWQLTIPTPAAPNRPAALGSVFALRINEWMADPFNGPDWLEIFNSGPNPVELTGISLSDETTDLFKYTFPPLSYIGTGSSAFLLLEADSKPEQGLKHLPFALSRRGERIIMSTFDGYLIDLVQFGPQQEGVSEGRYPDGADTIQQLDHPTPEAPNAPSEVIDQDHDGLPQWWEQLYGLNPLDPTDAELDLDGDGLTNLQEYLAGTDPNDAEDSLRILSLELAAELHILRIRFLAAPGRTYSVLLADTVVGPWSKAVDVQPQGCRCPVELEIPMTESKHAQFIRVVTPSVTKP